MRWAGHINLMGEMINAYNILVGKPEGKRSLKRPKRRWNGNTGKDLSEIEWKDMELTHLAQDMDKWWVFVKTVMNLQVP
jgi:hypothetical protein